jgi:hypothetical protein
MIVASIEIDRLKRFTNKRVGRMGTQKTKVIFSCFKNELASPKGLYLLRQDFLDKRPAIGVGQRGLV